uniref:Uncharacterized protein n=1 Tax=Chromera velia CCMP2878 TaxID=1169474 RepID=A0A0G4H6B5_9ALVE|eukprot:Cvel_24821.t1-p1 / transcript=Cvel_24821.t1 / gene=Cvel_24821 / organism=Chromera_velia_CCMP2878 / gene_product=hypothetical protein / transcript_product=hypothetical protein / location=Cvel_scaffold2736:2336-6010(+) / protein_length=425 / sequence_SO=supercontig / SO=protein_coding / is_pseudo=false
MKTSPKNSSQADTGNNTQRQVEHQVETPEEVNCKVIYVPTSRTWESSLSASNLALQEVQRIVNGLISDHIVGDPVFPWAPLDYKVTPLPALEPSTTVKEWYLRNLCQTPHILIDDVLLSSPEGAGDPPRSSGPPLPPSHEDLQQQQRERRDQAPSSSQQTQQQNSSAAPLAAPPEGPRLQSPPHPQQQHPGEGEGESSPSSSSYPGPPPPVPLVGGSSDHAPAAGSGTAAPFLQCVMEEQNSVLRAIQQKLERQGEQLRVFTATVQTLHRLMATSRGGQLQTSGSPPISSRVNKRGNGNGKGTNSEGNSAADVCVPDVSSQQALKLWLEERFGTLLSSVQSSEESVIAAVLSSQQQQQQGHRSGEGEADGACFSSSGAGRKTDDGAVKKNQNARTLAAAVNETAKDCGGSHVQQAANAKDTSRHL